CGASKWPGSRISGAPFRFASRCTASGTRGRSCGQRLDCFSMYVLGCFSAGKGNEGTRMAEPLRFDDGAAYERMMGIWSRIVGLTFLDWLAPKLGLSWIDVGCGNGAFTEEIGHRGAPKDVRGVDPSEGQLAFARTRPGAHLAQFQQGDAMSLPFQDKNFDV